MELGGWEQQGWEEQDIGGKRTHEGQGRKESTGKREMDRGGKEERKKGAHMYLVLAEVYVQ